MATAEAHMSSSSASEVTVEPNKEAEGSTICGAVIVMIPIE